MLYSLDATHDGRTDERHGPADMRERARLAYEHGMAAASHADYAHALAQETLHMWRAWPTRRVRRSNAHPLNWG